MRSALGLVLGGSLVAALAFGVACGASSESNIGSSGGPGTQDGGRNNPQTILGGMPCDVEKVLADNCRKCHSNPTEFGARMPLMSLEDLRAPAKSDPSRKVYELVAARIVDGAKPMPPPPNAGLSAADIATLTTWAQAGAPEGKEECQYTPPAVDAGGISCTPDTPIVPASAFTMPAEAGDEYVCYGVDLMRPTATHVTAFVPRIDNTKIVHHVVMYESDSSYPSTPQKCSAGASLQWRMVTGWAPGGKGMEMPAEAGFPIKTTGATHYVVQLHYSNPQALAGQVDKSGFDLCTSAPRKYEADVMAFGTQSINMPAKAPSYERKCKVTVPGLVGDLHFVAAMPHMHKLGKSISTQLLAGGSTGVATDLGTVENYSFDTQSWLPIKTLAGQPGVVAKANDVIQTTCKWSNPTESPVEFGEETKDEMCYSFTVYYPKVNVPAWTWAAPALTSQCE